jgi:hypothetical protein
MPSRTRWRISVQEFKDEKGRRIVKVTRRVPELRVAETLFFRSKRRAQKKLQEWLL